MPRYLVECTLPQGISESELEDAVRRVIAVNATLPEIQWLRSDLAVDRSRFYFQYEAATPEIVQEAARLADLPADRVIEVVEVRAEMYPLSTQKEGT